MSVTRKGTTVEPEKVSESLTNSMLREMINELEETKLKLLLNIKELKEKLVQQKDDQADIYYYLNKKCDESFEVIASLEEQIINEQTEREISEKVYENRIEEMRSAHAVMEAKFTSKISELETRLEMLNSFSEEKEESEKTLKSLMTKLEDERNQFRVNTESIENRFLLERDKLRKTYDQKYEKIKKELEDSVEGKMSTKTKKTQIMNVIMKKELESQSKHAEKLLEINQAMSERDKAMKLELDVANSLNSDMTLRLAMNLRTIKALNEKVSALEAAEVVVRQKHESQLREKTEALIQLEARMNNIARKNNSENSKMDDMWTFLAQSFSMLRGPAGGIGVGVAQRKKGGVDKGSSGVPTSWGGSIEEHEKVLVSLVKEVVRKFPKLLSDMGLHQDSTQAVGATVSTSASYLVQSSSLSLDPSQQQGPGGASLTFASSTGIPSWDMKSVADTANGRPKGRSVAVQTEGRVAPYPDGSLWMEEPGPRSQFFQQQSAALAAANADGDNSSVGFHSVQSLWRGAEGQAADGDQLSVSLLSTGEEYSVKTASHVLQAPTRSRMKPSKVIAKMRRQNMRKAGGAADSLSLQQHQQHHQLAQSVDMPFFHAMSIEGASVHTQGPSGTRQPRSPVTVHLSPPYPLAPSPLSLGSGSYLPLSNTLGMRGNRSQAFAPAMAVSGQGFVAPPLVLPKL